MNNHTKYKECPFCKSVLSYKAEKCDNCARDLDTSKQKKRKNKTFKRNKIQDKKNT